MPKAEVTVRFPDLPPDEASVVLDQLARQVSLDDPDIEVEYGKDSRTSNLFEYVRFGVELAVVVGHGVHLSVQAYRLFKALK